ncbi:MAG: DUF5107 domain-containing protein, partial [Lentisphaeria bacterium]|nr:DUF5107 domain-containing protein [Lentisphaeria bacterium]
YEHREKENLRFESIILENDFLKAEFIPALGGRLWSLFDKESGRDLISDNGAFLPGNLAIRNAWFAGGIEYNCGRRGHDVQTCSPRFTAVLQDSDGTPVVRFYEISRDRLTPFQMDFYLPENSRFLYMRVRIVNPNDHEVPMYWWSNLALPIPVGGRLVAPAENAYVNVTENGRQTLKKLSLPVVDGGIDASRPDELYFTKELFFNIPDEARKFECVFDADGRGMAFASTSRLIGRKLFAWGSSAGGSHWQRSLLSEKCPDYLEIQGGLTKTQFEHIPMPAHAEWEWLEAYGALSVSCEQLNSPWQQLAAAAGEELEKVLPEKFLEAELARTAGTFALAPGKVIVKGSGWAALEELRRGKRFQEHLDFGGVQKEQSEWVSLLQKNIMPDDAPPASFMVQKEWQELLAAAPENWKSVMHLALGAFHEKDFDTALLLADKAIALQSNPWTLYVKANVLFALGRDKDGAAQLLLEACSMLPHELSLAEEALKMLMAMKNYDVAGNIISLLDKDVAARPLFQCFMAQICAGSGDFAAAEKLLLGADGKGIVLPGVREGELSVTDLFIRVKQELAKKQDIELKECDIDVPFNLDFRMFAK